MDQRDRVEAVIARMRQENIDLLFALHDGTHFIEKPDPVMALTGFKSLGPCAVALRSDGTAVLIVTPAWDAARAAEARSGLSVTGASDVVESLTKFIGGNFTIGIAGLAELPWRIAHRIVRIFPEARPADAIAFDSARCKTSAEIANARDATRIAELGYRHLLEIARPGMSEDDLAVEIRWFTKSLGADDNFLLLCAGPHNRSVAPSNGRKLIPGDVIVVELTPSYRGQLAQICRTISVGPASNVFEQKYDLVKRAMNAGIDAVRPGVRIADVCRSIDSVLEAEGYGEFCHPPYIRRRGHGLGFGTILPGDVALGNDILLEPDMLFMIHPNQYLPETGYLLCGEPVLVTADGAEVLSARQAALATIGL